jgi:hypothetical protein
MSDADVKIPSINDLTELFEKMGDGITWYIHLPTLKIYGFSHISNTWFPSYDTGFDRLVLCRIFGSEDVFSGLGIDYGPGLLTSNNSNNSTNNPNSS